MALSNIELSSCIDPVGRSRPAGVHRVSRVSRVSRGVASGYYYDQYDHAAYRDCNRPGYRDNFLGFRLARTVP